MAELMSLGTSLLGVNNVMSGIKFKQFEIEKQYCHLNCVYNNRCSISVR